MRLSLLPMIVAILCLQLAVGAAEAAARVGTLPHVNRRLLHTGRQPAARNELELLLGQYRIRLAYSYTALNGVPPFSRR